jgi:hypothetical protein
VNPTTPAIVAPAEAKRQLRDLADRLVASMGNPEVREAHENPTPCDDAEDQYYMTGIYQVIVPRTSNARRAECQPVPRSGSSTTMASITGASGNGFTVPIFRQPHEMYAFRARSFSTRTRRCASGSGRAPSSSSWIVRP